MPAYLIADVEWTDRSEYEHYLKLALPALHQHGGRYLVRGSDSQREVVEGDWPMPHITVIEFPSYEQARAFWDSDGNRAARPIRERGARSHIMLIDGVTAQP